MGRSTLKKTGWVGPRRLQIKMEALYFLACIASLWQEVTSFVPEAVLTDKNMLSHCSGKRNEKRDTRNLSYVHTRMAKQL